MSDDNVSAEPTLNKDQRRLMSQMSRILGRNMDQGVDPYGGQITPDTPESMLRAFGLAEGWEDSDLSQGSHAALMDALNAGPSVTAEDYLQGFEENVYQPGLLKWDKFERGQLANTYGSSGGGGVLQSILADSRALFEANMGGHRNTAYMEGLGAQEQSTQAARDLRMRGVSGAQDFRADQYGALMQAGDAQRQIQGQHLMEAYDKWNMSQPYNNPWLQQYYGPTALTPTIANVTRNSVADRAVGASSSALSSMTK